MRVQMAMLGNLRWQGTAGGLYELKSASIRQTERNGSPHLHGHKKLNPAINHVVGDTDPMAIEPLDENPDLSDTTSVAL